MFRHLDFMELKFNEVKSLDLVLGVIFISM